MSSDVTTAEQDAGNTPPVVMVIEDEVLVRMATAAQLREKGFSIIEAVDADEAMRLLEVRRDVSAVFSDVYLPSRIDGVEFARLLRRYRPDVPVLLTSGVIDGLVSGDYGLAFEVLAKPYDIDMLARKLHSVILRESKAGGTQAS